MSGAEPKRYRLFEVVGLELEYVVVDEDLRPRCLVEDAFRHIHGRPTSDVEFDGVGFSNELAAHVFEIKTNEPTESLAQAEAELQRGLRFFAEVLREKFAARLLPTGMHPFMHPRETRLWERASRAIYRTYASIFPIHEHGWLNVQASHVNLPFDSEPRTVTLHNAIACLIPYLPALAASSPVYEGAVGPSVDNRLEFYKKNQRRIPQITAQVVPEYITSFSDYRRKVYAPIRRALADFPGTERLQAEWVNSRGAIMRFSRRAIEIKVLDVQECIKADVAIAVFIRGALRHLVRRLETGALVLPDHAMLVADLDATIREGSEAAVVASHLRPRALEDQGKTTARSILGGLLDAADPETAAEERPYLAVIEDRIRRGNLSERIARQLRRRSRRRNGSERDVIREVYEELIGCLQHNTIWEG